MIAHFVRPELPNQTESRSELPFLRYKRFRVTKILTIKRLIFNPHAGQRLIDISISGAKKNNLNTMSLIFPKIVLFHCIRTVCENFEKVAILIFSEIRFEARAFSFPLTLHPCIRDSFRFP